MTSHSMTLNIFGRRWYFEQADDWSHGRRRAIRWICIRHIMPALGKGTLSQLTTSHVDRWLKQLIAEESTITVLIAASTLRTLLEAATAQGYVSPSQWTQLRSRLSRDSVATRCQHHHAKTEADGRRTTHTVKFGTAT